MKLLKSKIIATSNSMRNFPEKLKGIGIKNSKAIGIDINFSNNLYLDINGQAGCIETRVKYFLSALRTKGNDILWSIFGGNESHTLLPKLLQELTHEDLNINKKTIGFSDFTSILLGLYKIGFKELYHGPSFSVFCDPGLDFVTKKYFSDLILGKKRHLVYYDPKFYASDIWYEKENFGPREVRHGDNWYSFNQGIAKGKIIGGNIESILHLYRNKFMPDIRDHILFIEDTYGSDPSIFYKLKKYKIFDNITGLIVGIFPHGSLLSSRQVLHELLIKLELDQYKIPILLNFHCSHVTPMLTLPIGKHAVLNCQNNNSLEIWR